MKFEFESKKYLIEFQRDQRTPSNSFYGFKRTYTTVRVMEITGPGKLDRKIVREYTVGHNPNDRFSYDVGRKYALTLAMYDAPTKGGGPSVMGSGLSKAFRKAAWEAYHGRFENALVAQQTVAEVS